MPQRTSSARWRKTPRKDSQNQALGIQVNTQQPTYGTHQEIPVSYFIRWLNVCERRPVLQHPQLWYQVHHLKTTGPKDWYDNAGHEVNKGLLCEEGLKDIGNKDRPEIWTGLSSAYWYLDWSECIRQEWARSRNWTPKQDHEGADLAIAHGTGPSV